MKKSLLLQALLFAVFPMFAVEDGTASAAPSSTEPDAGASATPVADAAADAPANQAATGQVQIDAPAVVLDAPVEVLNTTTAAAVVDASTPVADAAPAVEPEAPAGEVSLQEVSDANPVDGAAVAAAPVVQTPTPVAQSGGVGDPVLETVKTPAHNVAEEIQEQIKKLEQLPAEVAAWFENKFIELAGHIKALL